MINNHLFSIPEVQQPQQIPIQRIDPRGPFDEAVTSTNSGSSPLTTKYIPAETVGVPKCMAVSSRTASKPTEQPLASQHLTVSMSSLPTGLGMTPQNMNAVPRTESFSGSQALPKNVFSQQREFERNNQTETALTVKGNDLHSLDFLSFQLADGVPLQQNILTTTTSEYRQPTGHPLFINTTYADKGFPSSLPTPGLTVPSAFTSNQVMDSNTFTTQSVQIPVSSSEESKQRPLPMSTSLPPTIFITTNQQEQKSGKESESFARNCTDQKGNFEKEQMSTTEPSTPKSESNVTSDLATSWRCRQCLKTFTQRLSLQMHVCSQHHPEKPYQCGHCACSFSHHEDLRVHVETHVSDKPYRCGFCSRTFAGSTTLNNHMRTHIGNKPYSCKKCGKSFLKAAQLARHKRALPSECRVTRL